MGLDDLKLPAPANRRDLRLIHISKGFQGDDRCKETSDDYEFIVKGLTQLFISFSYSLFSSYCKNNLQCVVVYLEVTISEYAKLLINCTCCW